MKKSSLSGSAAAAAAGTFFSGLEELGGGGRCVVPGDTPPLFGLSGFSILSVVFLSCHCGFGLSATLAGRSGLSAIFAGRSGAVFAGGGLSGGWSSDVVFSASVFGLLAVAGLSLLRKSVTEHTKDRIRSSINNLCNRKVKMMRRVLRTIPPPPSLSLSAKTTTFLTNALNIPGAASLTGFSFGGGAFFSWKAGFSAMGEALGLAGTVDNQENRKRKRKKTRIGERERERREGAGEIEWERVRERECVCVCVKMKKRVPDEWQALQAKIASAMKRKVQNRKCVCMSVCVCVCVCVRERERERERAWVRACVYY